MNVYDAASKLYNKLLGIYSAIYEEFLDTKTEKMDLKYDIISLTLDTNDYKEWFKKEDKEPANTPPMSPLEDDEGEVQEKAGIKS